MITRCLLLVLIAPALLFASETRPADEALIETVVERTLKTYREMSSYEGTVRLAMEIEGDEDHPMIGGIAMAMDEMKLELSFVRPNRIAIRAGDMGMAVYTDGEKLWRYMRMIEQYVETDAPEELRPDALKADQSPAPFTEHPVASLLLARPGDAFKDVLQIDTITGIRTAERNEREGWWISGKSTMDQVSHFDAPVISELWIDKETGLLEEVRVDLTEMMNEMIRQFGSFMFLDDEDEVEEASPDEEPPVRKCVVVMTFEDVRINGEIPDDRFVFVPGPHDEKVEAFDFLGDWQGHDGQLDMVGEPAPGFESKDLQDRPVALADYRDKVVVLDFWATWCSPCVAALPHVQELADRFKEKDVVVLGVNTDNADARSAVERVLERRDITLRQVLDPDGEISANYHVAGIPHLVLIDRKGIVQKVKSGFGGAGEVDLLAGDIEKLLKGESLFDPEELAREREERRLRREEDARDDDEAEVAAIEIEEVAPEYLAETKRHTLRASAYQAKRADVNGDGLIDLVLPSWQGEVHVITRGGMETQRIRFKGLSRRAFISDVMPIVDGEQPRWLIGTQDSGMGMRARGSAGVGLYDHEGNRLWHHEFDIPSNYAAETRVGAGDLSGDGRLTYVAVLSVSHLRQSGRHTWTHERQETYLMVIDEEGQVRSCRRARGSVRHIQVYPGDGEGPGRIMTLDDDGSVTLYTFDAKPADGE